MKNTTLFALVICSVFLAACDKSGDTTAQNEADLSGKASPATTAGETVTAAATNTADDVSSGEAIYKKHCFACHGTGAAGAPKMGDKAAWSARIAQGDEVLTRHAIEGFKGEKGYMPPKGGFLSISDADIAATVQYMVSQSR